MDSEVQDSGVETGNESNDSIVAALVKIINADGNINESSNSFVTENEVINTTIRSGNDTPEYPVTFSTINEIDFKTDKTNLALGSASQLSLVKCMPTIQTFSNSAMDLAIDPFKIKHKPRIYRHHLESRPNLYTRPFTERKMRLYVATNNIEAVERLLLQGVSPNNADYQKRTPLHVAACRGYTDMVKLLLSFGANPNLRDSIGNTPLHLAAVACKISVVTQLLLAGTNVLTLDNHGYNPLQLAQTKLRILQDLKGTEVSNIRNEAQNVIDMLLVYLQKQKDSQTQIEMLSNFCSKLSLSNTSEQLQDDVKTLLESLSLTN